VIRKNEFTTERSWRPYLRARGGVWVAVWWIPLSILPRYPSWGNNTKLAECRQGEGSLHDNDQRNSRHCVTSRFVSSTLQDDRNFSDFLIASARPLHVPVKTQPPINCLFLRLYNDSRSTYKTILSVLLFSFISLSAYKYRPSLAMQ
jgi:hypothetical protein